MKIEIDQFTPIGYVNGKPVMPVAGGSEPAVEQEITQGPEDTGNQQEPANTPEATQEPSQSDSGQQQNQQETKAPWSDFVEKFPTAYRSIAEEAAKEWDAGVTKRFQDLHSTYDPYKPFVEEWEPEAINQALQLAQALEADPESFYRALAASYGFAESEQGAANQGVTPQQQQEVAPPAFGEDDPYAPRLQQHEELLRTLADHIIGQETAKKEAQDAQQNAQLLDSALASLKQQYGEYDENYVLNAIANGADPEDAVKSFRSMVDQWAKQQNAPASNAPRVMGGGNGSIPSGQVDPAKLGRKETKDLVAEYLRTAQGG